MKRFELCLGKRTEKLAAVITSQTYPDSTRSIPTASIRLHPDSMPQPLRFDDFCLAPNHSPPRLVRNGMFFKGSVGPTCSPAY